MLVRRCELRDEPDALSSAGQLSHGPCARMTEFLLLDTAAWPLHKDDMYDLRWVVFFDTEVWLAQG